MTVETLREVEAFLDDCAVRGVTLDEARREISARILGSELHAMMPDREMGFFEDVCAEFLAEER